MCYERQGGLVIGHRRHVGEVPFFAPETCQRGASRWTPVADAATGGAALSWAAMILTALLSLGFPKPPDYSVLSRRLASLKSDEVRVRAVLAMASLRETTTWHGSSSSP